LALTLKPIKLGFGHGHILLVPVELLFHIILKAYELVSVSLLPSQLSLPVFFHLKLCLFLLLILQDLVQLPHFAAIIHLSPQGFRVVTFLLLFKRAG
jgi:hypothetical protein